MKDSRIGGVAGLGDPEVWTYGAIVVREGRWPDILSRRGSEKGENGEGDG